MLSKFSIVLTILLQISLVYKAFPQKVDLTKLKGMSIRNIGPSGMSGRVTAIDVDKVNHKIYVGTASGGLWLSDNGGISWKPIFDEQPTLSIGCVKVNPKNPLEIWVGTGEGNPRNSHNAGYGIFKSMDGGKTWNNMGLQQTRLIHRVLIDFDHPNTVYVGALGSAWGPSKEKGVFKTMDGGKTWNKILYVNDSTGVGEMVMDPQNPSKLIVNMWQFYRLPWEMKSGGKGSGIYITYDGGDHWKKISSKEGIPEGDIGRCGLAIAASNPEIVYALIEAKENALFKSMDGGEHWQKVIEDRGFNGRPFYFYEIYVDPQNPNTIYSLHTYLVKSIDGGKTYKSIADYGNAVHPDHHAFWIDPENPKYILEGNDGGLNVSYDGGDSWQFILNLPVGQFYHLNVDNEFPYHIYGGMQDNGSWVGPGFTLSAGGIRVSDWQEVYFGDGFDVAPVVSNMRYGYAMSQGGELGKYDLNTGRVEFIKPVHPDSIKLRFNWNAGMSTDPHHPDGLYYGSQFLHYSPNQGVDWKILSPDLTTNDTLRQPKESGGLTPDVTGAENNTTIISIAPSPVNKDVIWVGTDDGNLQLTTDGGKSWKNLIDNIKSAPKGAWIPQIEVSTTNAAQAFVVINNYRRNDYKPYLFLTGDYGKSWTNLVANSDVKGFVNAIVQDKIEPNLLFLGADDGLYISFDFGKNWNHWLNNFPQVQIQDMKIQSTFNDLVIASFGRSFWVLDDITPLRKIAQTNSKILEKEFTLLSSPDAYDVNYKSFAGTRFYAQADFNGANKNVGAHFLLRTNKPAAKSDSASNNKATISIYDASHKLVRDFKQELKDTGLQMVYWGLETNGLPLPSKADAKPDDNKPGGVKVLPGQYMVHVLWNGFSDSSYFHVKPDPRSEIDGSSIIKQNNLIQDIRIHCDSLATSYSKIKDVKKSIDLIEKLSSSYPDTIKKKITKLNEEQRKLIKDLEIELFGAEAKKGYERDPDDIMTNVYTCFNYIGTSGNELGSNVAIQCNKTLKSIRIFQLKMDGYLKNNFVSFRKEIEAFKLSPFKE